MGKVRRAARIAVLVGAAALLYGMAGCGSKTGGAALDAKLAALRQGDMQRLTVPGQSAPTILVNEDASQPKITPAAAPEPDFAFKDADGKDVKLSDFKGKVLVVNFWATWCAPCKVELPSLGRLQSDYAGKPLQVVAISVDKPEVLPDAKTELGKAPPLALYNDPGFQLAFKMTPSIGFFPTTVIYDKNGVERARLPAPATWDSPEARKVIDAVLAS